MKRFVVAPIAIAAIVLPAIPASAETPAPADYRAECEQGYTALKPLFDAILEPAKALFGPLETGLCGEQKHTPK